MAVHTDTPDGSSVMIGAGATLLDLIDAINDVPPHGRLYVVGLDTWQHLQEIDGAVQACGHTPLWRFDEHHPSVSWDWEAA